MEEHSIEASDGVRLWATRWPGRGGGKPVLFLHGFSGSSSAALPLAHPVARAGHDLVAPDLRGHGLSGKSDDPSAYSIARLTDDVTETLLHFGIDRAHVVGHCLGGMIAAAFAAAHPEMTVSLSLVATSLKPGSDRRTLYRLLARSRPVLGGLGRVLFPDRGGGHVDYGAFRAMSDWHPPRMYADYRLTSWKVADDVWTQLQALDLTAAGHLIEAPTLVVHGMHDTIFPAAAAERIRDSIPGARMRLLPRDNHVTVVLDRGSPLFEELVSFMDAAEGSPREGRDAGVAGSSVAEAGVREEARYRTGRTG